jgi:hypothetical protein
MQGFYTLRPEEGPDLPLSADCALDCWRKPLI